MSLSETWSTKRDEEVVNALNEIDAFTPEAADAILAEATKRGLNEKTDTSSVSEDNPLAEAVGGRPRPSSGRRIAALVVGTAAVIVIAAALRQADFPWSGSTRGFSVFEMVLFAVTWAVAIRMTPRMEKTMVQVYHFTKYDITSDEKKASKRPATLEAIAHVGGEPLLETGIEVEESQLDGEGFLLEAK